MICRSVAAAALALGMAAPATALTLAGSGFDDGSDGWFAINGARQFAWVASGGDGGGGYVRASDRDGQTLWFFAAPSSYLGDQLAAYGGSLSFALKSDSSAPPLVTAYADVHLLGANGLRLAYGSGITPGADWTHYSVALVADGHWRVGALDGPAATAADFAAVLGDLQALRIRGDYRQAVETTGLDAVVLSAAPVPEPASALLWLSGLLLAPLLRRGRR